MFRGDLKDFLSLMNFEKKNWDWCPNDNKSSIYSCINIAAVQVIGTFIESKDKFIIQ